jgi:hypothetical protein
VLDASDTEFGVLIALFGVGAVFGLLLLRLRHGRDALLETRLGVAAIGGVIAFFSLAATVWIAYVGAAAFGAAAAYSLASGMGADGNDRVIAFAAFHVVIRLGLSLAAIGAGVAGDLLDEVKWPWIGRLEPSRVVLLCSGIVVILASSLVRLREPAALAADAKAHPVSAGQPQAGQAPAGPISAKHAASEEARLGGRT